MTEYLVYLIISIGLFSLFALGLNLQWGFAGLINFGHVAFMTIGAYSTVLLSSQGVPLILAVIIGCSIASLLGLLIGGATLRLREDYLAIITIGISELIRLVALNEEWLTKGPFGVQQFPLPFANLSPTPLGKIVLILLFTALAVWAEFLLIKNSKQQLKEGQEIKGKSYKPSSRLAVITWGIMATLLILIVYINGTISLWNYSYKSGLMLLILIILAITYYGLETLVNSPWGRVLKAIREDEEVAKALGKNVFWYKLQALMLGGSIAGLAGSFYAWQLTTVYPSNFQTLVTFNAWTMVVLGGAGNNSGSILGTVLFTAYDAITRFKDAIPLLQQIDPSKIESFRGMLIGLILILLMVWRPQGILGKKEELTLGK